MSDYGPGEVNIVLGPGNRLLESGYRPKNGRDTIFVRVGDVSFESPTFGSLDAMEPGFAGFDGSGRAIATYKHTHIREADNTVITEVRVVEFPADGSPARFISGLPALVQKAYDNIIALSPNGAVLGETLDSAGRVQFIRAVNGTASTYTLAGVSGQTQRVPAAMNDNGDLLASVNGRVIEVKAFSSQVTLPLPVIEHGYAFSIGTQFGAVAGSGKVWRFNLNGAFNAASFVTIPNSEGFFGLARGDGDQFFANSCAGMKLTSFDVQRGTTRFGYVHSDQRSYASEFEAYRSAWSVDAQGRFAIAFIMSTFDRNAPEYGYRPFKTVGRIDSALEIPLAELKTLSVWSMYVSGPRPATVTKWGATPQTGDGITAVGGIYLIDVGAAATQTVNVQYFLSLDADFSNGDLLLRSDVLQLSSLEVDSDPRTQVYLPASIPSGFAATGTYYLIARLDPNQTVQEYDETNNTVAYSFDVDGVNGAQLGAEVATSSPLVYGEPATVTLTVTNYGGLASLPASIKLTIALSVSTTDEYDMSQFGTNQMTLPAIAPGQTKTLTFQTALPPYPYLQRFRFPSNGQICLWAREQGSHGAIGNGIITVTSPAVLKSRVDGIVWRGVAGTAATGVRVYLDANYNNRFDAGELSSITNSVGYYRIDYTSTATQHLMVDVAGATPTSGFWYGVQYLGEQRRFIFTAPTALNRVSGKVSNSAGVAQSGVRVFRDANNNSRYDAGELVSITNSTGNYVLEFAGTGSQHITIDGSNFTPSAGYTFTITAQGTQKVYNFTLTPPAVSKVAGTIFKDTNRNGRLDAGETKLAGRTVFADYNYNGRLDAGEASAITDATGAYLLTTRATNVSLRLLLRPGEIISLPSGATSIWLSSVSGTVTGKNIGVVVA